MKPILTRDEQIELMKSAEDRHRAIVNRVLSVPAIREVALTPVPTNAQVDTYTRTEMRIARCG